jgi:hypothetical protein
LKGPAVEKRAVRFTALLPSGLSHPVIRWSPRRIVYRGGGISASRALAEWWARDSDPNAYSRSGHAKKACQAKSDRESRPHIASHGVDGTARGHPQRHDHRRVREGRQRLDRDGEASEDRPTLHGDGVPTDARAARVLTPTASRLTSSRARPFSSNCRSWTSSTTRKASRSPSSSTSDAARLRPLAIPTVTFRYCSGRPADRARGFASTSITPTRSANGRTTAHPASAIATRASTKRSPRLDGCGHEDGLERYLPVGTVYQVQNPAWRDHGHISRHNGSSASPLSAGDAVVA